MLDTVDRVQRRFLRELDFSEEAALQHYKLAPLNARRDMAMLGALHKVNLGSAPAQLRLLFPCLGAPPPAPQGWPARLRRLRPLHHLQLHTPATPYSTDVFLRSLFGVAHLYNRLPEHVVATTSVKAFQRKLQQALLRWAELGATDWQCLYSTGWKRLPLPRFDDLFV